MSNTCFVGRSELPEYKETGISLFKDESVSSAHGFFEVKIGENKKERLYFVDCHSSNGTIINDENIEPNEPYLIHNKTTILLGESKLNLRYTEEVNSID